MTADRSHLSGAERIAEERHRQVALGWSRAHDDEHADGDLYEAAIAYLLAIGESGFQPAPDIWPWSAESWKPSADPVRNLEKAGALIAAEIDRLAASTSGGES